MAIAGYNGLFCIDTRGKGNGEESRIYKGMVKGQLS